MSYDIKFKQRAVEYQREGHTYKETCKVFKISETTLTRWINKEKEGKLGEVGYGIIQDNKVLSKIINIFEKYKIGMLELNLTQAKIEIITREIENRIIEELHKELIK